MYFLGIQCIWKEEARLVGPLYAPVLFLFCCHVKLSFWSSVCTEIAQVLKAYSSSSPELLNLENGQLILILSKNASGWWLGELQVSYLQDLCVVCGGMNDPYLSHKKYGLNNMRRKLVNGAT